MYVYVSNVLAVMDGWVVCVSPCSIAPTFLADLRMLSSATLAASGIRWAGPGCGRRGHVDRRPWSWSCHDRPTNFLVLPTFAMFSAHWILHSSLRSINCLQAWMDRNILLLIDLPTITLWTAASTHETRHAYFYVGVRLHAYLVHFH